MTTKRYEITSGPDRFSLCAAMLDRQPVRFTLWGESPTAIKLMIDGMIIEDGSGFNFNLELQERTDEGKTVYWTAFYDARRGRGRLEIK